MVWHQSITWTNVDLSVESCAIHPKDNSSGNAHEINYYNAFENYYTHSTQSYIPQEKVQLWCWKAKILT